MKCTECVVGKYANTSCGLRSDTLCLDCPNKIPALAHYELQSNVSLIAQLNSHIDDDTNLVRNYDCWWRCDETLVFDIETRACKCPVGYYYNNKTSDDLMKFDVSKQQYRPVGCVPCGQCPGTGMWWWNLDGMRHACPFVWPRTPRAGRHKSEAEKLSTKELPSTRTHNCK